MKIRHIILSTTALCLAASSALAADDEHYNGAGLNLTQKRVPLNQAGDDGTHKASAYVNQGANPRYDNEDFVLTTDIKGGYRMDKLRWNIGAPPVVNILSELSWKSIKGYQVSPSVTYLQKSGGLKGFYAEGSAYGSRTNSGHNQDSDYDGDNHTLEFSRSNNDASGGHSEGFEAGMGYAFDFKGNRNDTVARFMLLFGYALEKQTYIMENGDQTLSSCSINFGCITPPVGPFFGLKSSYETEWSLPFIGMAFEGRLNQDAHLKLHGKYYLGSYQGTGNWNLRSDFAHPRSFEHQADASGYSIGAEYGWMFYPHFELTLSADYEHLTTSNGVDTSFFSAGGFSAGTFNEAVATSEQFMGGLAYTF